MKEPAVYLVNITRSGRHTALVSTQDAIFVEDLTRVLQPIGYELDVTATPLRLRSKNGNTLTS